MHRDGCENDHGLPLPAERDGRRGPVMIVACASTHPASKPHLGLQDGGRLTPRAFLLIPHPAPYTVHLAPCTQHVALYTRQSALCTLHSAPCTLHRVPGTLHPTPPIHGKPAPRGTRRTRFACHPRRPFSCSSSRAHARLRCAGSRQVEPRPAPQRREKAA